MVDWMRPCSSSVHPRSRGEHQHDDVLDDHRAGSSPLARGTLSNIDIETARVRFIPARAGNTTIWEPFSPRGSVHPRSRGEHCVLDSHSLSSIGSSPLARGTRRIVNAQGMVGRFIPARAGNTAWADGRPVRVPVHPRSRGEHSNRAPPPTSSNGSSPLARGTRRFDTAEILRRRFIPARAGNTRPGRRRRPWPPVHPRSRGEHTSPTAAGWRTTGSSPLARGTPRFRRRLRLGHRFIPARAGNT